MPFVSFSCLLPWVERTPEQCWIEVPRIDILFFSWFQSQKSSFSPVCVLLVAAFFTDGLYQIEEISFIFCLLNIFIMKECWILANAISVTVEIIIWFVSLILLICYLIIDWWTTDVDFCVLNQFCNPGGKSQLILLCEYWYSWYI